MSILTKVQWLTTPQNGISKKKKKSVNDIGELVKLLNKITKVSHRRNNSIRIPVIHKLASKRKVIDTMFLVDEANVSRMEILKTVEEAAEEVKTSKKVLEEALNRVEAANRSKLAVEEALRKWRSENGQKRRSIQNSTKFKNSSYPSHRRKDSHLTDATGLNLINDEPMPVLRPTLSIGQILSRKLFLTEEFGNGMKPEKGGAVKRKMSLGQMLSRPNGETPFTWKPERGTGHKQQLPMKRKKFGFASLSVLMRKQNQQKKKRTPNFMCHSELD